MFKKILIVLLLLNITLIKESIAYFDFNLNCKKAYHSMISLRLNEAYKIIENEKNKNPKNQINLYLESYCDFLSIIISQDKNLYNTLKNKRSHYISELEKGSKNSPYYNYCLADVYFQWAVAKLVFIKDISDVFDGIKAAMEIKKSYELIEKNTVDFPSFIPNLKLMGLMKAMIDVVPENYKNIIQSIAFRGSFDEGVAELKQLIDFSLNDYETNYIKSEVLIILTFIEINLQTDKQKANFLKKYFDDQQFINELKDNALLLYAKARFEIFYERNNDAIETLENYPKSKEYYYFGFIDFLTGKVKQNRLDKDAIVYFDKYLMNYKGKHYIKTTYQQIAWYNLINKNISGYYNNILMARNKGASLSDTDKQAMFEAEKNEVPNINLLKSRLLCDGGYFQEAIEILNKPDIPLLSVKDTIEFYYRYARIYHQWDKINYAIPYYEVTLKKGDKQTWYYAANSALQLGIIYEKRNEINKAKLYYQKCLFLNPAQYKNSIHTKAKAGLKRLDS